MSDGLRRGGVGNASEAVRTKAPKRAGTGSRLLEAKCRTSAGTLPWLDGTESEPAWDRRSPPRQPRHRVGSSATPHRLPRRRSSRRVMEQRLASRLRVCSCQPSCLALGLGANATWPPPWCAKSPPSCTSLTKRRYTTSPTPVSSLARLGKCAGRQRRQAVARCSGRRPRPRPVPWLPWTADAHHRRGHRVRRPLLALALQRPGLLAQLARPRHARRQRRTIGPAQRDEGGRLGCPVGSEFPDATTSGRYKAPRASLLPCLLARRVDAGRRHALGSAPACRPPCSRSALALVA